MAKIRRIVRRVRQHERTYFDEQLWPIYIALVVLGGFSMGVSAAYLQFSGVPWYANAWTSLILVPAVVCAFLVAFRLFENTWIRRSMQLSMVLCAILHVALVVQLIETRIHFIRLTGQAFDNEIIERRPAKVAYQYLPSQLLPPDERPQQDFERPIDTQTPEPEPEPRSIARPEAIAQDRPPETPRRLPPPENATAAEPNVIRKNQPNEVPAHFAPEASRLSRQVRASDLKISQLIETPGATAMTAAAADPAPGALPLARATSESALARTGKEPTTNSPSETPQVARRTPTTDPAPDVSSQPKLRRQVAEPAATPRTQVAAADTPSVARQTGSAEAAPANTTSVQRRTASPTADRTATAEPVLDVARDVAAKPQRRDNPADPQPGEIAQSPAPAANRQPRSTMRRDVATTASVEGREGPPGNNSSTTEITPVSGQLQRMTAVEVTATRPSARPASEPRSADTTQSALQITRATGREGPTATANPSASPTLTRRTGSPSLPGVSQQAETAAGAVVGTGAGGDVSPTSTATRRQATADPQAGPNVGEPGWSQLASSATRAASSGLVRRTGGGSAGGMDSPATGSGGAVPTVGRRSADAVTNVVTTVGDVPANAGPQAGGIGTMSPSGTTISRQAAVAGAEVAGTAAAAAGQRAGSAGPAGGSDAARSRVRLAGGGPGSHQISGAPSIDPTGIDTSSPRRSTALASAATSPVAIENPAAAGVSTGTSAAGGLGGGGAGEGSGWSEAAAGPTRLVLSRGQGGIAGGGHSPNFGGSLPGGDGPALAASGSARRAEATQEGPPGDALTPSRPSLVARSLAGGDIPASPIKVTGTELGTIGGAVQVSELTASSGASLTRADGNARRGGVTAAKGTGDVDFGPTQIVAEGGVGRAAGGGQPELTLGSAEGRLARSTVGGGGGKIPLMALASTKAGDVAAPAGEGGGTGGGTGDGGDSGLPGPSSVAVGRAGGASAGGGPSQAGERSPAGDPGTAALVAQSNLSRADAAEGQSGGAGSGGSLGFDDEKERARRFARTASGGGPQVAIAGPIAADVAASPVGAGGDGGFPGASPTAAASAVAVTRGNRDGGAPSGGAPLAAGEPGEPGAAIGGGGSGGGLVTGSLAITRAEAADGPAGDPVIGGGSGKPSRAAAGMTLSASTAAESISIAGAPASGGSPDGAPVEAQGLQAAKVAGGSVGPIRGGPIGAAAGTEIVDSATVGQVGDGLGRRSVSPSTEDGPAVEGLVNRGAPGKQASQTQLSGGGSAVAAIPDVGPMSAVAQADMDHLMGGAGQTPMIRQTGVGMTINIAASDGPGGLGAEYTPEVGLNSRLARSDSVQVHLRSARFVKTNVGGLPAVSTAAIASAEAFSGRSGRKPASDGAGGVGAPSSQTEDTIDRGLAFLARYQSADGGWSLQGFPEEAQLATDTAATALAVLAFQGSGYNHREHQYKDVVRGGLDFLVKSQKENGDLFVPLDDNSNRSVWLYSHSLAAIALCEAYGMTQDPQLKEPAQKALDFIVAGQHAERGGWRYSPSVGTDTSVTGWMMMALKSGELAGLNVPKDTYRKIEKWLDDAQQSPSEPHLYRYNPFAPDTEEQRHGRKASKTMTAVGLLMRLYTGWRRDNANMRKGAEFLQENLPAIGTPRDPQRDAYYWYYGTQVMFHMGGDHWRTWNARLHPLLVDSQLRGGPLAGSWDPKGAVPDRWGPHGGRLYVTTLNLLSLEVFYRHLPLYEDAAK